MAEPDPRLSLSELCDAARVSPRTIRYYLQLGLLRPPDRAGPGATYGAGDLDRLVLIRELQKQHLPLAEIRRRLDGLSDAEVRALGQTPQPAPSSAGDYVRSILSRPPSLAPGPSTSGRSTWERVAVAPDVEIHVRRPLDREANRKVERLLELAHQLFGRSGP